MSKPRLARDQFKAAIEQDLGANELRFVPATEGEESQVFTFDLGGQACVLRINRSSAAFRKDEYAYRQFQTADIPIPRVLRIGQVDEHHSYCVTEQLPGVTLEDGDAASLKTLLEPTTRLLQAIHATDISAAHGFGRFDHIGNAPFESWKASLLAVIDQARHDWDFIRTRVDGVQLQTVLDAYRTFVNRCPNERHLVHGDFGSNNVLTVGNRITAVLDWENALYGDPLFDVATTYFWRTWLQCFDLQADEFEQRFADLPDYRDRVTCYQLGIGLWEICDNVQDNDFKMAEWALRRCHEVLNESR